MTINITNGDCLTLMKDLPDKSIDLFICDLPYGETNCNWDCVIDLDEFWKEFKRLRKSKRTACIHFCSTKFGYTLIKSNEKMFKMDMVWKKRNKTGGLQSRHRPMRNHEMVYFFYEQAPKYNRDKYHKRIVAKNKTINNVKGNITNAGSPAGASNFNNGKNGKFFEPPNPASVLEEHETVNYKTKSSEIHERTKAYMSGNKNLFEPRLPASVINEVEDKTIWGIDKDKTHPKGNGQAFDPPNPASVVEASEDVWGLLKFSCGGDKGRLNEDGSYKMPYDPPNPASVVEEKEPPDQVYSKKGWEHGKQANSKEYRDCMKEKGLSLKYEPVNPVSVLEEDESPEPVSMFESTKVFIGKRHHQTEKPIDILEFFLKYWSDEGDTILDPTMGSGSTGVACKGLKRNFIGYEMDEKIFKVAEDRLNKIKII